MAKEVLDPSKSGLPEPVANSLSRFVTTVQRQLGDNLLSIALYGSAARGEFLPLSSDLNLLVVSNQLNLSHLKSLMETVRQGRRESRLAPFFLTREDLIRSTDVFPLKFLDMKEHNFLLAGQDLLTSLDISREHIRLACEQSAKNMLLGLRQFYLTRAHLRPALVDVLTEHVVSFTRLLHYALELVGKEPPTKRDDLIALACATWGWDRSTLDRMWRLRLEAEKISREDVESLYEEFMNITDRLAHIVDQLEEPTAA